MAQKKSYSRYFIILQEDEKGYSLASDKIASGYAKLETKNNKCKISYYVQNLKKDNTPYYMILICNKKDTKKIINVGEMNIDDYGRADIGYEYPVDNICNSGISIDKISGAAIIRILDKNIISVMSGFSSMEVPNWRSFDFIGKKSVPEKQKIKDTENKKADKNDKRDKDENKSIFDKYEEKIEVKKAKKESKNEDILKDEPSVEMGKKQSLDKKQEQFTNKISDLVKEEHKEQLEKLKNENKTEDKTEDKENLKVETGDKDEIYIDNSSVELDKDTRSEADDRSDDEFFDNLISGFQETSKVSSELKRCKWYEVPTGNGQNMYDTSDYDKYTFIYYPMTSYYGYIKNYSHFLMGYKYDGDGNVKYMIYGIPGTKDKSQQPYEGRTGFVTWVPEKGQDDFGYWLMFYDFRTGTVDIPVENCGA